MVAGEVEVAVEGVEVGEVVAEAFEEEVVAVDEDSVAGVVVVVVVSEGGEGRDSTVFSLEFCFLSLAIGLARHGSLPCHGLSLHRISAVLSLNFCFLQSSMLYFRIHIANEKILVINYYHPRSKEVESPVDRKSVV